MEWLKGRGMGRKGGCGVKSTNFQLQCEQSPRIVPHDSELTVYLQCVSVFSHHSKSKLGNEIRS